MSFGPLKVKCYEQTMLDKKESENPHCVCDSLESIQLKCLRRSYRIGAQKYMRRKIGIGGVFYSRMWKTTN